jgi:hypothetical protein
MGEEEGEEEAGMHAEREFFRVVLPTSTSSFACVRFVLETRLYRSLFLFCFAFCFSFFAFLGPTMLTRTFLPSPLRHERARRARGAGRLVFPWPCSFFRFRIRRQHHRGKDDDREGD